MGSPASGMPAVSLLMNAVIWLSGTAAHETIGGLTVDERAHGRIDWIPIWPGIAGCSSISS